MGTVTVRELAVSHHEAVVVEGQTGKDFRAFPLRMTVNSLHESPIIEGPNGNCYRAKKKKF